MVKARPLPRRRVVAISAGLRELRCFMIRIYRGGVIIDMAGYTVLIQPIVNSTLMAAGASECRVAARQRELRGN